MSVEWKLAVIFLFLGVVVTMAVVLSQVLYYRAKTKRLAKERAQDLADLRADLAQQADANRIRRLAEWDKFIDDTNHGRWG